MRIKRKGGSKYMTVLYAERTGSSNEFVLAVGHSQRNSSCRKAGKGRPFKKLWIVQADRL